LPSKKIYRQTMIYPTGRRRSGRRRVRPAISRDAARSFLIVVAVVVTFFVLFGALSFCSHKVG
jgi:hypothetical protein